MPVPEPTLLKGAKKKFSGPDRRCFPRRNPSDVPSLKSVAFNQGLEVQVVNVSIGGMLLETEVRLRPQMKVLFKLVTSKGPFKISGCVLRSSVVSQEGRLRYRSAIAFDHPLNMLDELNSIPESTEPAGFQNSMDQAPPQPAPGGQSDENEAVVTLIANYLSGISLET